MATTLLLLSDVASDVKDLLPAFPLGPWRVRLASLKQTSPEDLIRVHPDVILVDATANPDVAADIARDLALAWEIGLPPIMLVVDEGSLARLPLDTGADDLVMHDAGATEIGARLSLLTRRAGLGDDPVVLRVGDLTVNPENYQVYVRGQPLDLTYKEFELLKFLAQRPGRVCDRDMLLREVWGYDYYGGTRTVDVHIRRLRAKLGAEHEALIETIRNVGYRLVPRPKER